MGRLDDVQRALAQRNKTPDASEILNFATNKTLESMMERFNAPLLDPERFEEVSKALGSGMKALNKQLKSMESALAGALGEQVIGAVTQLESSVQQMISAINAIEIPKTVIPPFPEYPQPKEVDLAPLHKELVGIYDAMGSMNFPVERVEMERAEMLNPTPREWQFNVKRNQAGFIRTVEVKEK